jgi:hypothetical protein
MRAKFLDHEAVHFVAGKIFPHDGKTVFPGEEVTDAREWRNLEALVRGRFLWPVAEDPSVLPAQMQREVRSVEVIRAKVNADSYLDKIQERDAEPEDLEEEEAPADEPVWINPEWTIKQMLTYLDEHPQDITIVLDVERSNHNRPRLIKKLEERLAVPNEEEIDV